MGKQGDFQDSRKNYYNNSNNKHVVIADSYYFYLTIYYNLEICPSFLV